MSCTEIFKLKEMLEKAKIPFVYTDESEQYDDFHFEKYHIEYPCSYKGNQDRVCSIIQGFGTYGVEQDLLEIMGLLTDEEEKKYGTVKGSLTAEDVFERIKEHYEETCCVDYENWHFESYWNEMCDAWSVYQSEKQEDGTFKLVVHSLGDKPIATVEDAKERVENWLKFREIVLDEIKSEVGTE